MVGFKVGGANHFRRATAQLKGNSVADCLDRSFSLVTDNSSLPAFST